MSISESLELYLNMYRIREAESLIIKHYPDDEMMTPMHMSTGQEAIAVAICNAIGSEGQIFGSYRSHAIFLAKTKDVDRFFGEMYGKVNGTIDGKGGSMHLASPEDGLMCSSAIVASSIPLAVGAAHANKQQLNEKIACAYFGDGAVDEGVFWESLNAACVMQLPVMFVCEDNGYAVHSRPEDRQGFNSLADVVSNFDCNVYTDDSYDVEAIYSVASEAADSIKSTGKPGFLHIKTYRYLGHIGIDDDFDVGYRTKEEFKTWFDRDSIKIQRDRLLSNGVTEEILASEEQEVVESLTAAIQNAKDASFPSPDMLYTGVFNEGT